MAGTTVVSALVTTFAIFGFMRIVPCTGLAQQDDVSQVPYGVDISYPIHHASVSTNFPWVQDQNSNSSQPLQVLGDRQAFYEDFLRSCRDSLGPENGRRCDETESHRIQMNLMQPPSMRVRIEWPPKSFRHLHFFIIHSKVLLIVVVIVSELHRYGLQKNQMS
jgi:hypothetical protein